MLTFWEYLGHHAERRPGPLVPQAQLVANLIRDSGRQGISRGKLGSKVDLEPKVLNDLLDGLVRSGGVVAYRLGDYLMYRRL
jgi:hypothetical protein